MFQKSYFAHSYLAHVLDKTIYDIRNALESHPQSKRITFSVAYKAVDFLLNRGFSTDDIFNDIHIVMYSM